MDLELDNLFDMEPAQEGPADGHAEPLFADDDDDDAEGDANGNADGENQDEAQEKHDETNSADPKPKKKRVSRPQVKLNGDRLCGPRGIGVLEETFADLAFAGRGHERSDLNLLLGRLQHWAHRMFPKMPFDQAIERIEKLGKTKQVQVNVKKLRMGLDVLPTEVGPEQDATERGEPERDVFDELTGGSPPPAPPPDDRPATPPAASTLTEEQQERMRTNREAAQLRRMRAQFARQQQQESEQQQAGSERVMPPPDSTTPAGSQSDLVPGTGAADSDVEMEEETSAPRLGAPQMSETAPQGESAAASGDSETRASRAGHLQQMSETAPQAAARYTEVNSGDWETSVPRTGHLHQMSETAPDGPGPGQTAPAGAGDAIETEAIVIPDSEADTAAVGSAGDTEPIVIPDGPEAEAIVIPDDMEPGPMLVDDTDVVLCAEATEASDPVQSPRGDRSPDV